MAANTGRYLGILTGIVIFLALNGFIDHDWVATRSEREIMTAHGIHPAERPQAETREPEIIVPASDWTRDEAIGDTDSEGTPAVLGNDTYVAVGKAALALAVEARAEAGFWRGLSSLSCSGAAAAAAIRPGVLEFFGIMASLSEARSERWSAEAGLFTAAAGARVITSPVHGIVERVFASAGQSLSRRDMIMELGPRVSDPATEARK